MLGVALGMQVERTLLETGKKLPGKPTRLFFPVSSRPMGEKYVNILSAQGYEASLVRKVERVEKPGFIVAADMKSDLAQITAETIRKKGFQAKVRPLEEKSRLQIGPVFSNKKAAEQYRDGLEKRGYDLSVMPNEEIKAGSTNFVQIRKIYDRFTEQILQQSLSRSGIQARVEEDT
ncbi:MAG: hypothetical protein HYU64_06945 [Armatimonadetes bacterium]|nr:hypothetical protein [Armatimonadota bacterium]